MRFVINNMQGGYVDLLHDLRELGVKAEPRGLPTRELIGCTIVLEKPQHCWADHIGRNLNPGIGAVEALQLIGGFHDPELMIKQSKEFAKFRDGGVMHGAYGPRVRPQLPRVVERLRSRSETRQAVMTIWDPLHDLMVDDSADIPCTLSFQFLCREGQMQMVTTMRSNDAWLGLPYDVFQFCQLGWTVANILDLEFVRYHHLVGSLHLYERDFDKLSKLHQPDAPPTSFRGVMSSSADVAMAYARRIAYGEGNPGRWVPYNLATPTELWLHDAIKR